MEPEWGARGRGARTQAQAQTRARTGGRRRRGRGVEVASASFARRDQRAGRVSPRERVEEPGRGRAIGLAAGRRDRRRVTRDSPPATARCRSSRWPRRRGRRARRPPRCGASAAAAWAVGLVTHLALHAMARLSMSRGGVRGEGDRAARRRGGRAQRRQIVGVSVGTAFAAASTSSKYSGTSTSRALPPAPLDTRPSASIMSTSRAARLKPTRSRRWRNENRGLAAGDDDARRLVVELVAVELGCRASPFSSSVTVVS